jgi:hypothetical protein
MILTRKEVNEIVQRMKLDNKQKQKMKKLFCIPRSELLDKVYYTYSYLVKDGIWPRGKGVITKARYSQMKADHDNGTKKAYGNSEYITVYWEDMKFSEDIDEVEKYLCDGDTLNPYNDIIESDDESDDE